MKEATGELNMTVVTIVAIAALLAFFYIVIWPNIQAGVALSSACNAANGQKYFNFSEDGRSGVACNGATGGTAICTSVAGQCCYKSSTGKVSARMCEK